MVDSACELIVVFEEPGNSVVVHLVVVNVLCVVDSLVVKFDDDDENIDVVIGCDIMVVVEVVDDDPHGSGSAVVVSGFSISLIQTGVRPISVTPTIIT